MLNHKSKIKNQKSQQAFTLVEILVAIGVMVILGAALIGLMSAAMSAWRRGAASRQVHEKVQAFQRQIADDLAAAVLDPPPVPDFHYALDTLWDLPEDDDPYYIVYSPENPPLVKETEADDGQELSYFAPASADDSVTIVLRIRVPFTIGAALLKARLDTFHDKASASLEVGRNNPNAVDPADREKPDDSSWQLIEELNPAGNRDGAIGGGERDISQYVEGGTMVFIRATLDNDVQDTAQFLRGDRLCSEGRPVLILDCYRATDALSQRPRPSFVAYWQDGAQVLSFARTIPGENEKPELRLLALGGRGRVVYRLEPYPPEANKPGHFVLKRGFEAPINDAHAIAQIPTHDFLSNVLYFGVTFWGGDTNTWETRPDVDPDYSSREPIPHPPSQRWLSSRYLPEQVQVTIVLEPERGERNVTVLTEDIPESFAATDAATLHVRSTRGFYNIDRSKDATRDFLREPRHFIRIGDEWLFYDRAAAATGFVIPKHGRGDHEFRDPCRLIRGTFAQSHVRGDEVYRGETFVFTVRIPAFCHWQP